MHRTGPRVQLGEVEITAIRAQGAQRCSFGQVEQRKTVGAVQAGEGAFDAVAVGVGLDHRPHTGIWRRGAGTRQVGSQRGGVDQGFDGARHLGSSCGATGF